MFAVGYGDIHPVNSSERLYALVTQVVGAMVYGYIIGTISYLTEVASPRASALRKRTDELKDWMSVRKLPRRIRHQIIRHMKYVWNYRTLYNEGMVLDNLSGDLRRRLVFQSYEQVIMTVRLLRWKGVDGRMIELIATSGKPQLLKVGDFLVRKGDIVHGVYVVRKGHVHGLKCFDLGEYGNYVERGAAVAAGGVGGKKGGVVAEGVAEGMVEGMGGDMHGKNPVEMKKVVLPSTEIGFDSTQDQSSQDQSSQDLPSQAHLQKRKSRTSFNDTTTPSNGGTAHTAHTTPLSPTSSIHVKRRTSLGMGIGKRINRLVFVAEDGHTLLESDVLKDNGSHTHAYHAIATSICDLLLIPKSTMCKLFLCRIN